MARHNAIFGCQSREDLHRQRFVRPRWRRSHRPNSGKNSERRCGTSGGPPSSHFTSIWSCKRVLPISSTTQSEATNHSGPSTCSRRDAFGRHSIAGSLPVEIQGVAELSRSQAVHDAVQRRDPVTEVCAWKHYSLLIFWLFRKPSSQKARMGMLSFLKDSNCCPEVTGSRCMWRRPGTPFGTAQTKRHWKCDLGKFHESISA